MNRLFFLLSFIFLCNNVIAQIEFVSENNGMVTVRTEGTDKTINAAITNAEQYVFYIIFYLGIPGSELKKPLIEVSEAEAERQYKDYFDAFYSSRYHSFI